MQPLNYVASKIVLGRVDSDATCIATGFYWCRDERVYLITNWHNVTGWDPIRDKALSPSTGFRPDKVRIPLLFETRKEGDSREYFERKRFEFSLYDDDRLPLWLEHPVHGRNVDVVALELFESDPDIRTPYLNAIPEALTELGPVAGDDVFVLGFPGGIGGGHELALWKKGSIASQPEYDLDGLPKVLIDTATRQGMSGAPVIIRRTGLVLPRGVENVRGKLSGQELIGTALDFLGVYSGRLADDEFGVHLGIVWRAEVIDQIIDGAKRGSFSA